MLARILAATARFGEIAAGAVLVAMTAYMLVEIVLRWTLGVSSNQVVEFVGYGLATMTFLGAAQTVRDGGMLRINLLLYFLPEGVRKAFDLLCIAIGIFAISFVGYYYCVDMYSSYVRGYETEGVIALPLWVPPLGLVLGSVLFLVEMVRQFIMIMIGGERFAESMAEAT
ncbi:MULTISPECIES: TRAP transporter small permease [Chelativorans]|jgi:TRAP-type C4-dicarboxylate transport system permease small subunit|uniref:TRAP transporter small permease protein n=1 Tax=Chelativorans sp. (strain BNC1) TaxID=266779 RepID=Q11BZ3_CHESB|nr:MULTISPECIES: TRAP transporter small permease [Chelativorans]